MNKKIIIISAVVALLILGVFAWQKTSVGSFGGGSKAAAIKQAQTYQPEGMCTQSITPAVHIASGATYTFNNGCLPPGWRAE